MLDTQTKRRIDDCRDILVGKLPDPKAQIEQITIGLIYKFMDDMDKEAVELGGQAKFFSDYEVPDPEFPNDRKKDKVIEFSKYAWDKLMHPKVTANEMLTLYSEAIEGMEKNPNIPQLFRDIFNNAYLPYRDPETLKLFLKTIGEFEYTHSEKLGDAFEYLLSVMGSQGDAGQFRTPRHIIDFLVAIIDPDKTDTILDPACGTAGFLISAYKHILLKYSKDNKQGLNIYEYNKLEKKPFNNLGDQLTPDDRKKLIQNFVGYDISPDMVRLSLVNLYLHGFNTPNIHEYDTLSSEDRWNESFDVVLANPPFMSPKGGIRPHKKFTISSNRSEVLFVDYIAEHLNPNGKAGIIVPEGIIFQSGTAYKDLRKMLVENHLYAVVSLPAGVFNPYSGVKTSILLMDKEVAKTREEVLFIKIDNDGYNLGAQRTAVKGGQLEEAIQLAHNFVKTGEFEETSIAHLVLKATIAKSCDFNLGGDRYVVSAMLQTSNFSYEKLEDVTTIQKGSVITKATITNGNVPVIAGGQQPAYYHNEPNRVGKTITVSSSGAYAGFINYFEEPIYASDCTTIQSDEKILRTEFLYQLLKYKQEDFYKLQKGGAQPHVYGKDFGKIQIPLPPISIQEEIVSEIEGYQRIIDGAKAVVANYKPKIDIDPDWEMVELGQVCDITSSRRIFKDEYVDEGVPFYRTKEIVELSKGLTPSLELFISQERYTEIKEKNDIPKPGDILVSAVGTLGVSWIVNHNNPFYFKDGNLVWIKDIKEDVESIYLKLVLDIFIPNQIHILSAGAAYQALTIVKLKQLEIPIPDIETQRQIVAQIEKEQELVNANKQLIEIFEQKIKDRIAKVWGEDKTKQETLNMAAEPQVEYAKS